MPEINFRTGVTFFKLTNISFGYKTLPLCFHSWKLVWCLRATSLIVHLIWIWISTDSDLGLWQSCSDLFPSPPSFCENKGPHTVIPHRHLETSLSCPRFLFQKKNECIVAFTSYGNNFWNSLTVKSNGFVLFIHWNCCQYAKFFCVVFCDFALILECSLEATFPCYCLVADYSEHINRCGS